MNTREAFKFGFLLRCAEEGLTVDQISDRTEKLASAMKTADVWNWLKSFGLGAAKAIPWTIGAALKGGALAAGGGALLGAGSGYALSKALDDTVDTTEARDEELIAEYHRALQDLLRRRQIGQV